jgi:excisionase family DNA binding protein
MTLFTAKELAELLRVKEKTVYAWASQGKIPTVRINGVRRFDVSEIEAWLKTLPPS